MNISVVFFSLAIFVPTCDLRKKMLFSCCQWQFINHIEEKKMIVNSHCVQTAENVCWIKPGAQCVFNLGPLVCTSLSRPVKPPELCISSIAFCYSCFILAIMVNKTWWLPWPTVLSPLCLYLPCKSSCVFFLCSPSSCPSLMLVLLPVDWPQPD